MEERRASSSSSRYIYRSYKCGKRSGASQSRDSECVCAASYLQNVGYDRLLMRALPGVAQLRGLLRMLWKDVSGRQGGKCRVGEERKEGEGGIPRRSFLARFSEPKKQKRETGDARCITGMMDDHTCRQLRRKRSLSIYKKLPSIVTTRTILRYLDLHKFVDAFTSKKKQLVSSFIFRIIVVSEKRGYLKFGKVLSKY